MNLWISVFFRRALVCFLLWGAPVSNLFATCLAPEGMTHYRVEKIYDGDTISVRDAHNKRLKVRFLGVNTPEHKRRDTGRAEAFARVATDFITQRIERNHNRVQLLMGQKAEDHYGRRLAWVFVNNLLLAEALLDNGLGYQVARFEDTRFVACLRAAQEQARARRLGVWSESPIRVRHQVPTGFAVITGRALNFSESKRAYWVNLDGDLVLQFNKRLWRSQVQLVRSLVGQRIVAQGWISKRRTPSRRYKNHILSITHPAMLHLHE